MVVYPLELDVVNESLLGRDRHRSLQVGDVLTPPPYRKTMMLPPSVLFAQMRAMLCFGSMRMGRKRVYH